MHTKFIVISLVFSLILTACTQEKETMIEKSSLQQKLGEQEKELEELKQQHMAAKNKLEQLESYSLNKWLANRQHFTNNHNNNVVLGLIVIEYHLEFIPWRAKESEVSRDKLPKEYFDYRRTVPKEQYGDVIRIKLTHPIKTYLSDENHQRVEIKVDEVIFQKPLNQKEPNLYMGLNGMFTHYIPASEKFDYPYNPETWINPLLDYDLNRGELFKNGDGDGKN